MRWSQASDVLPRGLLLDGSGKFDRTRGPATSSHLIRETTISWTLITTVRSRVAVLRTRLERLLLWRVWERMLEIEFVDRSVALAGKAFVSFFPLVIVVAAFVPERIRSSIFSTLTTPAWHPGRLAHDRLKEAFASSDDVRKATGVLGLVLTFFFASSFTTALQRVYLRAWRRPPRAESARTGGGWSGWW